MSWLLSLSYSTPRLPLIYFRHSSACAMFEKSCSLYKYLMPLCVYVYVITTCVEGFFRVSWLRGVYCLPPGAAVDTQVLPRLTDFLCCARLGASSSFAPVSCPYAVVLVMPSYKYSTFDFSHALNGVCWPCHPRAAVQTNLVSLSRLFCSV